MVLSRYSRTVNKVRRKGSPGFTLVEITVTCLLLAVLALAGTQGIRDMTTAVRADRAVRAVASLLEWARWSAVRCGCPYKVVLDGPGSRILVFREEMQPDGDRQYHEERRLDLERLYPGVVFGAPARTPRTSGCQRADAAGIHFLHRSVRFLPASVPDRCGSLYLVPKKDLPDRRDRLRAVSVLLGSGRVRLWRFDTDASSGCEGHGGWLPL